MKKVFLAGTSVLAAIITISLFSCQPEVQPYTQRTDSTGGLLSYVTGHTNTQDSFFVSYQYDGQNKWAGNRIFAIVDGDSVKVKLTVTRDASGYVTKIVSVDSSDASSVDIETIVVQHNAAGRYTTSYYSNYPNSSIDTTEYVYDNSGKIIRTYLRSTSFYDTTFSYYTGSNLDSIRGYYGIGNYSGLTLNYDTKTAPSNLGNEAFLLEIPFLYGTGNVISYTSFASGSLDGQGVITYTFNAANKPATATAIALPSNEQYTAYYHYR